MAHSGEPEHIYNLYKSTNILRYYINMLSGEEPKTIEVALECMFIVLSQGEKLKGNGKNPLVMDLHTMGAVDTIEKMQYHKSDVVYDNVSKILTNFF